MLSELVTAVTSRRVSALELTREALGRIAASNASLNAVVALREEALRDAAELDLRPIDAPLPLRGMPVLVKDVEDVRGMRTTFGSRLNADAPPADEDGIVPARLRAAGAVIVGKTNTSEFAWEGYTANPLFGATVNPWNSAWSPGGSSGGSAAALAAGMVPIATGTDGGGSIRSPAALCGLVGLKPTNGVIARRPIPAWIDFSTDGPFGTSVADVRLLLAIEAGPSHGDPSALPRWPIEGMPPVSRILATTRMCPGDPPVAEVETLFHNAVARVDAEIAPVAMREPASIFSGGNPDDDSMALIGPEQLDFIGRSRLESHGHLLDPALRAVLDDAARTGIEEHVAARRRRFRYARQLDELLGESTLLLSPVLTVEGFTPDGRLADDGSSGLPNGIVNTTVHNMTGHPAISIPAGISTNGIPFGLMVTGPRFRDDLLLDFAQRFEASFPWPRSAPGYLPFDSTLD